MERGGRGLLGRRGDVAARRARGLTGVEGPQRDDAVQAPALGGGPPDGLRQVSGPVGGGFEVGEAPYAETGPRGHGYAVVTLGPEPGDQGLAGPALVGAPPVGEDEPSPALADRGRRQGLGARHPSLDWRRAGHQHSRAQRVRAGSLERHRHRRGKAALGQGRRPGGQREERGFGPGAGRPRSATSPGAGRR